MIIICHPIEQQFENRISPYAQKLLKSRIAHCLNYTMIDYKKYAESSLQEHTSEEENIYRIQLQASSNSSFTHSSNLANENIQKFTKSNLQTCDLAIAFSSKEII